MQKRNGVLNIGIITFIDDALEQHFEKGNIDFRQSLRSGILGGLEEQSLQKLFWKITEIKTPFPDYLQLLK